MGYRSYSSFSLNTIWVLIGINFVIFLATSLMPQFRYSLGMTPVMVSSQPWTIVTAMFVHSGFWHLFGNMITLYFFGNFLYRLVGENRFLLAYIGGGLLGNILYILLNMQSNIPVVGASGAVFALAGALAVMMPNIKVYLYFLVPMRLWLATLLFFGLWSIPGFIPGVAWQAHLGGLVGGLIAGYFFKKGARYYHSG